MIPPFDPNGPEKIIASQNLTGKFIDGAFPTRIEDIVEDEVGFPVCFHSDVYIVRPVPGYFADAGGLIRLVGIRWGTTDWKILFFQ